MGHPGCSGNVELTSSTAGASEVPGWAWWALRRRNPAGPQDAGSGRWGKAPGWGGARGQARLGTHRLVVRTGGRRGRGRGRRRQAGWRLGVGVRAVPQGIPVLRPPRPGPPPPHHPFPPAALPSGSAPGLRPRCHVTGSGWARGAPGERRLEARRGAPNAESRPTQAARTSQVLGAPEQSRREGFSRFVRGFRKSTALPPPVPGFR